MGMEVPVAVEEHGADARALSARPSILLLGPRDVGKRSILNKLTKGTSGGAPSSGVSCHGWRIDTKYYTADVSIWVGPIEDKRADDGSRMHSMAGNCEAVVMVFDLSDSSSFDAIRAWADGAQLESVQIILCVGNKADRVPEHFGHVEYRRWLLKRGESSSDPHPEFLEYGLERTEGSSLLAEEEDTASDERRRACIEWCSERGIEYIETCAINEDFDKCLSVEGDSQGISRVGDALSAHMWPGMVMKPLAKLTDAPPSVENDEAFSDDESEISIEYELLSNASAEEVWDVNEHQWKLSDRDSTVEVSVFDASGEAANAGSDAVNEIGDGSDEERHSELGAPTTSASSSVVEEAGSTRSIDLTSEVQPGVPIPNTIGARSIDLTSEVQPGVPIPNTIGANAQENGNAHVTQGSVSQSPPDDKELGIDDVEKLMQEMLSLRENMRNMSDSHRRDTAARLAMQMAVMFGGDDEGWSEAE